MSRVTRKSSQGSVKSPSKPPTRHLFSHVSVEPGTELPSFRESVRVYVRRGVSDQGGRSGPDMSGEGCIEPPGEPRG